MTITIELPPETEEALLAAAAEQGKDAADIVRIIVEREFSAHDRQQSVPNVPTPTKPAIASDVAEWVRGLFSAASAKDEPAFVREVEAINWDERTEADFVRSVHLALAAGAHLAARHLAVEGLRHYPGSEQLHKIESVLAPPEIISPQLPPDSSVGANENWLRANANQYRGLWVALRNGNLLSAASTLRDLRDKLEQSPDLFMTKVA